MHNLSDLRSLITKHRKRGRIQFIIEDRDQSNNAPTKLILQSYSNNSLSARIEMNASTDPISVTAIHL